MLARGRRRPPLSTMRKRQLPPAALAWRPPWVNLWVARDAEWSIGVLHSCVLPQFQMAAVTPNKWFCGVLLHTIRSWAHWVRRPAPLLRQYGGCFVWFRQNKQIFYLKNGMRCLKMEFMRLFYWEPHVKCLSSRVHFCFCFVTPLSRSVTSRQSPGIPSPKPWGSVSLGRNGYIWHVRLEGNPPYISSIVFVLLLMLLTVVGKGYTPGGGVPDKFRQNDTVFGLKNQIGLVVLVFLLVYLL